MANAVWNAAASGYRMPGEFEPHAATWMAWPCRADLWGDSFAAVKTDYARLARTIAEFEPVAMVAPPDLLMEAMQHCGADVRVVEIPIDDSWIRDSGPTFLARRGGGLLATTWRFNAWGGKYSPYAADAALAGLVAADIAVPSVASDMVLEGGSILSDGEGTLITTESCLLNPNRNPSWRKAEIDAELKRMLGAERVIWLPGDPSEKETDGHIDGLLAIVAPGKVLLESTEDRSDPRYEVLKENQRALKLATDAHGRHFQFQPIEEAEPGSGARYCRSYVNLILVNGAVIAPAYGLPSDARVAKLLAGVYADRKVVMLPIGAIASGGGGFHCITQQQPSDGLFAP